MANVVEEMMQAVERKAAALEARAASTRKTFDSIRSVAVASGAEPSALPRVYEEGPDDDSATLLNPSAEPPPVEVTVVAPLAPPVRSPAPARPAPMPMPTPAAQGGSFEPPFAPPPSQQPFPYASHPSHPSHPATLQAGAAPSLLERPAAAIVALVIGFTIFLLGVLLYLWER